MDTNRLMKQRRKLSAIPISCLGSHHKLPERLVLGDKKKHLSSGLGPCQWPVHTETVLSPINLFHAQGIAPQQPTIHVLNKIREKGKKRQIMLVGGGRPILFFVCLFVCSSPRQLKAHGFEVARAHRRAQRRHGEARLFNQGLLGRCARWRWWLWWLCCHGGGGIVCKRVAVADVADWSRRLFLFELVSHALPPAHCDGCCFVVWGKDGVAKKKNRKKGRA